MKTINLKTIKDGLSRDEMRNVKGGGCAPWDVDSENCRRSNETCNRPGSPHGMQCCKNLYCPSEEGATCKSS